MCVQQFATESEQDREGRAGQAKLTLNLLLAQDFLQSVGLLVTRVAIRLLLCSVCIIQNGQSVCACVHVCSQVNQFSQGNPRFTIIFATVQLCFTAGFFTLFVSRKSLIY